MIEEAIVSLLTADPGVSALIGTRLYPLILPETGDPTLSGATYQVISDLPEYTLSDGIVSQRARVQITAWAQHAKAAKLLAIAISSALADHTGTAGGIEIANAWIASGMTSNFESSLRRYRVQSDYMVLYTPAG